MICATLFALVNYIFVVGPRRLHASTDTFEVPECLTVLSCPFGSPEHGPVSSWHLPGPPSSLKVPLVNRVIAPATPAHSFREASADHGIEEDVGDTTSTLASLQDREFVKVRNQARIFHVGDAGGGLPCEQGAAFIFPSDDNSSNLVIDPLQIVVDI